MAGIYKISGVSLSAKPSTYRWYSKEVVGTTLSGVPVMQGYESVELIWDACGPDLYNEIYAFWNVASPSVTITLTNPQNNYVTYSAMMHEPKWDGVYTSLNLKTNLVVRFSHLE